MKLTFVGYGGAKNYPCYEDNQGRIYFDTNFGRGKLLLYTGATKNKMGEIVGEPTTPIKHYLFSNCTVIQYFDRGGKWNVECDTSMPYRVMDVDVAFTNSDGEDDEVQFSIKAYDKNELSSLFNQFCKEQGYPNNTVSNISVYNVAVDMDALEEVF